jgi:regulator of protease activity HflC (stomatin/prohibitin superfamily)
MAKTVAEAEGEARSQVERARGEGTSMIERAHGEAEANRLRQASITPQLLEWKRLENQRALIDKWNGDLPKTVLGGKENLLMPLPTDQR